MLIDHLIFIFFIYDEIVNLIIGIEIIDIIFTLLIIYIIII